jgi:hydrogenase maturation protein HypF
MLIRRHIRVRGTVQGVGFRPYVYRLAASFGLTGQIYNDDDGVVIHVEGHDASVDKLLERLVRDAPSAAQVLSVDVEEATPRGDARFVIAPSPVRAGGTVPVSPDLAVCADCRREFDDPTDRRFGYPFLNCTQCGPRYTIVRDVPYDRARTTMAAFSMCEACAHEYHTVGDRRHHAQPVACPACGPTLEWVASATDTSESESPTATTHGRAALDRALASLSTGGVIAVKGIGGYHLVCDATNDDAVRTLRARKQRPHQALALLVADLEAARAIAELSPEAESLLQSSAAPIVLVPRRDEAHLSSAIAPDVHEIGVMLAYTPLHVQLAAIGPLVCTSANLSQEPIVWRDADALERLAPLVEGWLRHDREIAVPCDDSVWVADAYDAPQPVRRSRGYAPSPLMLPRATRPAESSVLAVGAELKATLAVTRADAVYLSGHLGDVGDPLTLDALALHAEHLLRLFDVRPTRVACDAHPGYLSSHWARRWADAAGVPVLAVQHHHAHLVALQADAGRPDDERVIAFTFDGTGYGPDGSIWGGEVLLGNPFGAQRVAQLRPFDLPGGDAAVREPARLALAALHTYGLAWDEACPAVHSVPPNARALLATQLSRRLNVIPTSSMGRLFDVCAALVGFTDRITYEGQAAVRLATAASRAATPARSRYTLDVQELPDRFVLDPTSLLDALCRDGHANVPVADRARGVHDAIADAMVSVANGLRARHGDLPIGLTGGVFQNRLLQGLATTRLVEHHHVVRRHHRIPCNDGGLALGQAVIARVADLHHPPVVVP